MELPENKLTDFIKSSEKAKWIPVNNHSVNNFTEDDIERITNNYSTPIGQGGFGQVYRGSLDDGTMVAVKKYIRQNVKDGFAKEMIVHCQINHKNVVRLLGYCSEDNALMIVTEYVSRGNLKDLLFGSDAPISLDARLRIAIECADALGYMHSSMYQPMIHGDIKPDNILLDHKLGAKLSDFGLSRLLSMQTQYTQTVTGSIGYMDPVYYETGLLDPKSDVYSFGLVLLELITRAKASENGFSTGLKRKFTGALGKGKQEARKMFDTKIANERDIEILDEIGNLAAQCFAEDITERPEMKEVLVSLHMLRRSLRSEKAQEKIGRQSSSGTQVRTQMVDNHGSSIPRSSSNSSVTYKFRILDIFNRKSRMSGINGGQILKEAARITILTIKDLKRITRNYSTVISQDHTGFIYKGHIDGQEVSVKRLVCGETTIDKEVFVSDLTFLFKVQHTNIISLLGCCLETEVPMLVYKFAPNKSVHELLHCYNGTLPLDLRLGIAIGSAQALGYLHCYPKVHGNVTSTCILLDEDFVPKITDIFLGLMMRNRMCSECSNIAYLDPVYVKTGHFTSKSDVYSFGTVLLELISRKQPRMDGNSSLSREYLKAFRNENSGKAMFDKEIAVERNILILEEMGKLAMDCLSYDVDKRPKMVEVVERLQNLRRDLKHTELQNQAILG